MSITGSNNPFSCDPVVFANANTIISLGTITRAGNIFTFSVGFVWKINGVTYQNTAPVELTIAEATEGFNRIDNALLNTSNTIELQQGLESDTIALQPVAPDINIILTTWNISGETIGEAVAPTSDATKEDKVSGVIAFGTNNYTATVPEVTELLQGFKVLVTFQNTNTVSASTLNVNGLGAFAIAKNYSDPLAVNDLKGTIWLMFDTANWVVVGAIGGSGGGGASSWGSISGTLSAQTDLQTALNGKQATLNETNFGSFANALTEKTTLVDADLINLVDSADSNKAKKVSVLNFWHNYFKGKVNSLLATFKSDNFLDFTSSGQTQIDSKIPLSQKAVANGVATLGADSKIPNSQLPVLAITDTFPVATQAAMLALSTAEQGDVCIRTDLSKSFILAQTPASTLANWKELLTPTDSVTSVDGQIGVVDLNNVYVHKTGNEFIDGEKTFTGGVIYTKAKNISNLNLNHFVEAGFYDGSYMLNAPDLGWFYVTIERYSGDDNWLHQTATTFGSGNIANKIYTRVKTNNDWGSWKEVAYTDSFTGVYVPTTGNSTIAGTKTFSSSPIIPNASASNHPITAGQADGLYQPIYENTGWITLSHNLPSSYSDVVLQYKIKDNNYIINFKATCDGTGVVGANDNFLVASNLPSIDSEKLRRIVLDNFEESSSAGLLYFRLISSGEPETGVDLYVNLRDTSVGTTQFIATLPILKM